MRSGLWRPIGSSRRCRTRLTLDRPLRVERLGERRVVGGRHAHRLCRASRSRTLMGGARPGSRGFGQSISDYNMGADVHYSGTVSAAFEGVILGVPAVAVSLGSGGGAELPPGSAASRARVAEWVLEKGLAAGDSAERQRPGGDARSGVKLTRLGERRYTEGVIEEKDPRGRKIYWIGGGRPVWEPIPDTDFHEVASGYVSVTPLHLDMTDRRSLERMREHAPSWADSVGSEGWGENCRLTTRMPIAELRCWNPSSREESLTSG